MLPEHMPTKTLMDSFHREVATDGRSWLPCVATAANAGGTRTVPALAGGAQA
jgi:hypothetical protein